MTTQDTPKQSILLECRPEVLNGAVYDRLPFPQLGPLQEVAFDVGVTAVDGNWALSGVVVRAYAGHQMLIEQRWPERYLRQKTGLDDMAIPEGTGVAVRSMHLQLQAYERLTHIELTAVATSHAGGESTQATIHVPVEYPELRTVLSFPLAGAWWAIQAGDWSDLHKQDVVSQPYALDFVKLGPDSQFFAGAGTKLEEHYSWDQPVFAAASGTVVYAGHDMPDNLPGALPNTMIYANDPRRMLGNAVAIDHGDREVSYYAHLQQASLEVRVGDTIKGNVVIGRVGNSGLSPGPHLHFHVMEGPRLHIDRGLPLLLSQFSAGGQHYSEPIAIPTRMIVMGPVQGNG